MGRMVQGWLEILESWDVTSTVPVRLYLEVRAGKASVRFLKLVCGLLVIKTGYMIWTQKFDMPWYAWCLMLFHFSDSRPFNSPTGATSEARPTAINVSTSWWLFAIGELSLRIDIVLTWHVFTNFHHLVQILPPCSQNQHAFNMSRGSILLKVLCYVFFFVSRQHGSVSQSLDSAGDWFGPFLSGHVDWTSG